MNKRWFLLSGIAWSFLLGLLIVSFAVMDNPWEAKAQSPTPGTDFGDEAPVAPDPGAVLRTASLAPNAPGDVLVYFTPQDNNGTATVIFLYNTSTMTATVNLKTYHANNLLTLNTDIPVAAGTVVRLISDSLTTAAPPPSWIAPNSIVTNFTDSTVYGALSLPPGVKLDGYVVFNGSTGIVDPNNDQGAVPLRFSADPITLLLPVVSTP